MQYKSVRQRRLERQREDSGRQVLGMIACFLAFGAIFVVWRFVPPIIPRVIEVRQPGTPTKPAPGPSAPGRAGFGDSSVPEGWVRLNPNCHLERKIVAKQIQGVLDAADSSVPFLPPYASTRVRGMLADINSGKVCVGSEQNVNYIVPNGIMEVSPQRNPPLLTLYLNSLNPAQPSFAIEVGFSMAHERTHQDLKGQYPNTLEGFLQDELETRRRVCEYGVEVFDFSHGQGLSGYLVGECKERRTNHADWEAGVRKRYTRTYYAQQGK